MRERNFEQPQGDAADNEKIKIAIVDISDAIDKQARDVASHRMTAEKKELEGAKGWGMFKELVTGAGLKKLGKKIWKHQIGEEYYYQKEKNKAKQEILESGDIFTDSSHRDESQNPSTGEQFQKTKEAIVDRFTSELDGQIHEEAGEENSVEEGFQGQVKALIKEYAAENPPYTGLGPDARRELFDAERTRIIREMYGEDAQSNINLQYADNLFEVAEQLRQKFDHEEGLKNVDFDIELTKGRAVTGVRTEATYSKMEKFIDKVQKSKFGLVVNNEALIAGGLSIAYCATAAVGESVLKKIGRLGLISGAAAGIAYFKEGKRQDTERNQHAVDMAQGRNFDDENSPRRNEMDELIYETVPATELTGLLQSSLYQSPESRTPKAYTEEMRNEVINAIAATKARISLSDRGKLDLISYSTTGAVEGERRDLDVAVAQVQCDLLRLVPEENQAELLALIEARTEMEKVALETENRVTDQNFAQHREKARRMKALQSLILGATIGTLAQETAAFFESGTQGLAEHGVKSLLGVKEQVGAAPNFTPLEALHRYMAGSLPTDHANGGFVGQAISGSHNSIRLPEGTSLQPAGNGSFDLMRGHDVISQGIQVDHNGITPDSRLLLEHQGIGIHQNALAPLHGESVTKHVNVDAKDYVHNHSNEFHRIHRSGWEDNDTFKPDRNELRLWDPVIKGDGMIHYSMAHMTQGGSFHNGEHINAQELMKHGKLQLWLSASRDTQFNVHSVPIDHNGDAIIDPHSEIGKLFFKTDGSGKTHFIGRFAEVSHQVPDSHGVLRGDILATDEGPGFHHLQDLVTKAGPLIPVHEDVLSVPDTYGVDSPWFIPLYGRTPLEPTTPGKEPQSPEPDKKERLPYDPYNNQFIDPERAKLYQEMMSDRLKKDPKAKLNFSEEYLDYFEKQRANDPENFMRLAKLLSEKDPTADLGSPMSDNCKALVCIPAYDLGEGQNVGKCLEQYYKQIESGSVRSDEFEIVLYLNHYKAAADKVSVEPGAEERVAAGNPADYDTLEVIKQFKAAHPEMKIRVLQEEFPEQQQWGRIIKTNYDAAVALSKSRPKNADRDITILTNDVDVVDLSDNYLRSIIDTFENDTDSEGNHKLDGALGRIDHHSETYKEWPNFFLATRFDQFIGAQRRHGRSSNPREQGPDSPYSSNGGKYDTQPLGGPYSSETVQGERHIMTQGRNSILRASSYMAIGGANIHTDAGADTELANQVVFARRGGSGETLTDEEYPLGYINKAWLETNPRRELMTYKEGRPITTSWSDWRDKPVYGQEGIDRLKNLGEDEQLDGEKLAYQLNHIMQWYGMGEDNALVQRALSWLGFEPGDYQMVEKQSKEEKEEFGGLDKLISFTNLDHIQGKIDNWKTKRERLTDAEENRNAPAASTVDTSEPSADTSGSSTEDEDDDIGNTNSINLSDVSNPSEDESEKKKHEKYLAEKMKEKIATRGLEQRKEYINDRLQFISDEASSPEVSKWTTENLNGNDPDKLCKFFGIKNGDFGHVVTLRKLVAEPLEKLIRNTTGGSDSYKTLELVIKSIDGAVDKRFGEYKNGRTGGEVSNDFETQLSTIENNDIFEELKEDLSTRTKIMLFHNIPNTASSSVRKQHKDGLFRIIDRQIDSLSSPAGDLAKKRLEELKGLYEVGYAKRYDKKQ